MHNIMQMSFIEQFLQKDGLLLNTLMSELEFAN